MSITKDIPSPVSQHGAQRAIPAATRKLTVGFVGFGEVNTPRSLIESKCNAALSALEPLDISIVSTDPVSDDPQGRDCVRAVNELSASRLDALVVCIAGWIPSQTVINVISEFQHLPMMLWGLAGHYEQGRLITTADQAGTSAIRKTLQDLGYQFRFVFNCPGKPPKLEPIADFIRSVSASRLLQSAKIGMMGYRDMKLYATLHDGVSLKKALGVEIEVFEMLEMVQRLEDVSPADVQTIARQLPSRWKFEAEASPATIEKSVRCFLALKSIIEERKYSAVSLIDVDGMKKLLNLPPAMVFMLIADELNLPTIPENDCLGSVTQLIVRALTGQPAPYFEFYEFMEDRVLVGVPDYVPAAVVEGNVRVRPTRFGGFAEGILNVSRVRSGPVTLVRLLAEDNGYALHCVTGTAVPAKPWEEAGWQPPAPQLPGLEVILDTPVEDFAERVASQHYILAYGDISRILREFCRLKRISII